MVGGKEGRLEVLDVGSGDVVTSIEAHKGAVWALTLLPDNSGLISGSADHEAKFWEWEVGYLMAASSKCLALPGRIWKRPPLSPLLYSCQANPDCPRMRANHLDSPSRNQTWLAVSLDVPSTFYLISRKEF